MWIGGCMDSSLPAVETGVDAVPLAQVHRSGAQAVDYEPDTLGEEDQQQGSGKQLRFSEAFTHEKAAHDRERVFYHGEARSC